MEQSEKELENRLREVGNKLGSPPSDVDELIRVLEQTEVFLSRVEQSPSTSMSSALRPTLSALVTKDLLYHIDTDVKVAVAACISEITRITAPDAPYDDELMKEVFAVIVDAFGKFDDLLGCSYRKRVSILETVAKVRSCVVMLDLECDDLILRMFRHFLNTIRPEHTTNIFSSMVTIMTLVLEESEDISKELVLCLLSNVQKSNKVVLPVASRLAEKVISKCATRLKPYILAAVQSAGASLSDYGDIVTSICQSHGAPGTNEANGNKLLERTVSDELLQESGKPDKVESCPEVVELSADKSRKELDNGGMALGNGNPAVESLPKNKLEHSFSSEQDRINVTNRGENDDLSSIAVKAVNKQEFMYKEPKSGKQHSSVQSTDASDSSWVDGEKEASETPRRKAGRRKESKHLKLDTSDKLMETDIALERRRENEPQSIEGHSGENACVSPTSPSDAPHSGSRPKRGRPANAQKRSKRGKVGRPAYSSGLMDHELLCNLEGNPSLGSGEKTPAVKSDMKLRKNVNKETGKKVAETSSSGKQQKFTIKTPKVSVEAEKELEPEKDDSGEPNLKDKVASYRASNSKNDIPSHSRKILSADSRKKRQRGKELTSDSQHDESELNKDIVGCKIEVWWPDDQQFYKGMVEAFDAKTKKHKVVYDDGDVEMLTLVNEEWRYADDMKRVEQEDIAIPEVSLEPPLKKRRASSGSLTKQEKAIATSESGSKSRGRPRGKLAYDSAGSKSPAKRKGRPPNQTSRPSTPNEEAAKTSGKDEGNKAESLKTTHSNDLLDDTKIVDAMTSSGSKPRGRPKSSAKLKRRRRSGGNSISETPTIEAKEAESSHRSSPHDETFSRKKQEDDSDVKSPDGSSSRSAGKTGRKRRK